MNQQLRWDAGFAASRDLVAKGAIGRATVANRGLGISGLAPLALAGPGATPGDDLSQHPLPRRHPLRVGRTRVDQQHPWAVPGQAPVVGETLTTTVLEYPDGLQASIAMNHYDQHGTPNGTFKFLGTMGALEGTIGQLYDPPEAGPIPSHSADRACRRWRSVSTNAGFPMPSWVR